MVLERQKPSSYNEMLGRMAMRVQLSPLAPDQESRPLKRQKLSGQRSEDAPGSDTEGESRQPRHSTSTRSSAPVRLEIPDSESENEDNAPVIGDPSREHGTDLEQALPPVQTDKEAIDQYEAMRAADGALSSELQERLGRRAWVNGKSSIYVDAFNLALETVLDEESHLFNDAEMKVFEEWRSLGYEAQYLYVRLFLRKTSAWHRINRLGYYSDIADMDAAVAELYTQRKLPHVLEEPQTSPGELEPPEGSVLGECFSFADCSDDHISTLEEASSLLMLDELKGIAKEAKVRGKNKSELLQAFRRSSGSQKALGFPSLQRTDTEDSQQSTASEGREESPTKVDPSNTGRDDHYLRKIMSETGQCIRLSLAPLKLFERVHLIFYRSTEWTEKSLTTIILARIARRNFPNYIVSRSANIFSSRSMVLEFEASLRTQFRMDNILEFHGTPTRESLGEVIDIFEQVLPRWRILLEEEQRNEESIYSSGEGAYLRRLSPAWVYTRIVHKGASVLGLGIFKDHAREHAILSELISQRLFHHSRRGSWYQRKALLEEHYMGGLSPAEGRAPEEQKKHWKKIALQTCEDGLQDNLVHLMYHYDLQKRLMKLEKQLKIPKRLQHDFQHTRLTQPVERTFKGIRIERPPPPPAKIKPSPVSSASNHNRTAVGGRRDSSGTLANANRRGAKTIWLDPVAPENEVSVEAMCLSHYRTLGWKGYHTEGGVIRTVFALLFYDVLFTYIPNVFQTPYQTCPLDLHTDAFYPSRMSEVNSRLAEIANGEGVKIVTEVWEREQENRTVVVGLDWGFELEDLKSIVGAFGGERLATVCKVFAQEYGQRGGGMPDLFLWQDGKASDQADAAGGTNSGEVWSTGDILFAEVKSENDRLSDTQRLWIHVLTGAGINVELCNALASEVRSIQ